MISATTQVVHVQAYIQRRYDTVIFIEFAGTK